MSDTIAAIATARAVSAIGILRLTGPDTAKILDTVFRPKGRPVSQRPQRAMVLGDVLDKTSDDADMFLAGGVDFNYCAGHDRETKLIATLYSPKTGRAMDVITDQPGVQCYTGQGLDVEGKDGVHYDKYAGVCLETQHYPDSIHHPQWPTCILRAGETFRSFTRAVPAGI